MHSNNLTSVKSVPLDCCVVRRVRVLTTSGLWLLLELYRYVITQFQFQFQLHQLAEGCDFFFKYHRNGRAGSETRRRPWFSK